MINIVNEFPGFWFINQHSTTMAASGDSVIVLNQCQVRPPQENLVSKMSLRLTCFDILWLYAPSVQRLVFYDLPQITRTKFLDEFIPKLKHALSLILRNYLPVAGNLIIPQNHDSGWPEILYTKGDSVILIVAQSNADFDDLTANHAINCCEFQPLVPELTQRVNDSGSTLSSVFAFQVTLFPNMGISIGITNHPAAGDGSTSFRLMRIWSMKAKFGEHNVREKIISKMLPFYHRNIIGDPEGVGKTIWAQWNDIVGLDLHSGISTNTNKVRQKFFVNSENVDKLRSLFPTQVVVEFGEEREVSVSTFKVVCAYVWTCLVKSRVDEVVDGEELEHFVCFGQCRTRIHHVVDGEEYECPFRFDQYRTGIHPLVTSNYFGNCLAICLATGKYRELVGEGAIKYGVELITSAMNEKLHGQSTVLKGAKEWLMDLKNLDLERDVLVAGTPSFNYYNLDFGWGKPVKFEFVSNDKTGAISLCRSREYKRGVEVGLCLPKHRMNAFAAIFHDGLKAL